MARIPQSRIDQVVDRFEQVEARMGAATDPSEIVALSKEHAELKPVADKARELAAARTGLTEAEAMMEGDDPDMAELAREEYQTLREAIPELEGELQVLLLPRDADDSADDSSVILEVRAGTGGDEAALFAGDLFRMYQRFASLQGWKVDVVSVSEGDAGGYKEITANISGDNVFGLMKWESGVHRVQRVPATETQGRIHTSAATVAVLPAPENIEIEIRGEDIRIDTMRASGAGGQHVNTTDSAVRITHQPTGIVVASQNDRSQHKNRATAMNMLKARLFEREMAEREAAASGEYQEKSEIGWGHQIRSYVLQPYQMVKDLRTGVQSPTPDDVLDGALDPFISAALAQRVTGEKVEVEDTE